MDLSTSVRCQSTIPAISHRTRNGVQHVSSVRGHWFTCSQ